MASDITKHLMDAASEGEAQGEEWSIDAKALDKRDQFMDKWFRINPGMTSQIKNLLLTTLGCTDVGARAVASQLIAAIAQAESPANKWPGLGGRLVSNMRAGRASPQETFDTLANVVGKLDSYTWSKDEVNLIFTKAVKEKWQLISPDISWVLHPEKVKFKEKPRKKQLLKVTL
ncbi:OLC1v1033176C1 [Oldenlandia corymbosa var. corymbosa]|uniref:OLC1v1033176C1 n=1 Tax=Oldenlandia corymbosa var. corymbosa TaxID=529605 RepID=A0AAV1CMR2_OLDCO|nr:OLC1v1033176C1 [Oldenlandia corymbosa var. corymbosa]